MLAWLSKIELPHQRGESFLFNVEISFSPTLVMVTDLLIIIVLNCISQSIVQFLVCYTAAIVLFENTSYQTVFRETITLVQIPLCFCHYQTQLLLSLPILFQVWVELCCQCIRHLRHDWIDGTVARESFPWCTCHYCFFWWNV